MSVLLLLRRWSYHSYHPHHLWPCLSLQVGGSHAASTGGGQSSMRGPKRPQPLAPFCKYPNAPGTLKPWEGGLVLLDGSAAGGSSGGGEADWQQVLAAADGSSGGLAGAAGSAMQPAAAAGAAGAAAAAPGAAAAGGVAAGGDIAALQEENQRLREQLERALGAAQQWGRLNAQLQQVCAEGLLANGSALP